ncbi:MAG: hypothetical protein HY367_03740 [Candidatus Aenigmarchaeota archaeon]|nr:hypothetical protein [Candidatus Aenigmarchaeota archaeon]
MLLKNAAALCIAGASLCCTHKDPVQEFIREHAGAENFACRINPNTRVPEGIGTPIESHVNRMVEEGYALGLDRSDLWHGHVIMRRTGRQEYASLGDVLSGAAFFLYHTDEAGGRWDMASTPADMRTPRSIIGFPDGSIMPARSLFSADDIASCPQYAVHGTIHSDDITRKYSSLQDGHGPDGRPRISSADVHCTLSSQFYIIPDSKGALKAGRQRFDAYFECE